MGNWRSWVCSRRRPASTPWPADLQAQGARCGLVRRQRKADEIRMLAQMHGAKEVLFDQALSPAQQRNLERQLEMPVNDRTLLILEIFAQRARSHEGKLQVELAKLRYLSTRLVRRGPTWSASAAVSGPGAARRNADRAGPPHDQRGDQAYA